MMLRYVLFILLTGFLGPVLAQQADTAFKKEWIEIDTLIVQKDLTRTAIDRVRKLYAEAKRRQEFPHIIRSLVYLNSLEDRIKENNPNRAIRLLKTEIAETKNEAAKAVLHSLLAMQYKQYYFANRWKLGQRTRIEGDSTEDISTKSSADFHALIIKHYMASLNDPLSLQKTDISKYSTLLIRGNDGKARPTLYDLLVYEALEYFTVADNYVPTLQNYFGLTDPKLLAPAADFARAEFKIPDSSSSKWITVQLYQRLISFHLNDADKNALVHADLRRLEWINQNDGIENGDELFAKVLAQITKEYPSVPATTHAWYLLAQREDNKASGYQPFGDTSNRYAHVKAEQIILHALELNKGKDADISELEILLANIRRKQLDTQTEKVNIPGKPFRTLVTSRNIDTLYGRIIVANREQHGGSTGDRDKYWKTLTSIRSYRSFIQVLPKNTDHQAHNVEIKIDALPSGEYALLTSSGKDFSLENDHLAVQFIYVSNIALLRNDKDIFVVDRTTGDPIPRAAVTVIQTQRNGKEIRQELKTDKNGHSLITNKDIDGRLEYIVRNGKDSLRSDEYSYYYGRRNSDDDGEDDTDEEFEEDNARVHFFTDRAIYRPGQTVYFKGIAVTKDRKTKLAKLVSRRTSGWVFLNDTNRKKIDSVKFSLNEFGSFAGSFRLPQHALTGQFSIETDVFDEDKGEFSVEEYKRPRFEVDFDKVKGSYRLNDSIHLTGTVKAFAGNSVSGANVKYTVKRKSRYMPWEMRKFLPEPEREISHGEISTDAKGVFHITFKAAADDLLQPVKDMVLDFEVEADVTDQSGETHSASTSISAGFKAIKLNLAVPGISEVADLKTIRITSVNYSNEKEPAKVEVRIFPLQPEQRLIRKRYWTRPDQFVMSKPEYISNFPTDEYDNETNRDSWQTSPAVITGTLNTADSNIFAIKPNTLHEGFYRVETIAKDKFGEEVKQVSYMQLFDSHNGKLAAPAYQFEHTIKSTVEPGERAAFLSATSAQHVYVITRTARSADKTVFISYGSHGAGFRTSSYTPTEKDRGTVTISEVYVVDNRVYNITHNIYVPWSNKDLQISYASYRNKTEPGSAETWSVGISGYKSEKVAAELLTAMYDASLDEFKRHSWNIPELWNRPSPNNSFSMGETFGTGYSDENYIPVPYSYSTKTYDRLPTNGSELWNQSLSKLLTEDSTVRKAMFGLVNDNSLQDVVVVGYEASKKKELTASVAVMQGRVSGVQVIDKNAGFSAGNIKIRGINSLTGDNAALFVVNGQVVSSIDNLDPSQIGSINVMKDEQAIALYGSKAANGVVVITTTGAENPMPTNAPAPVQVRTNLNETAFFFPQLHADSTGNFSFSFTMPEALTKWKWMTMAHTKDLAFGSNSTTIITQKKLMVQPNAPRFMREGDRMELSSSIVNLTDKEITGQATLELFDPSTNTPVDGWFNNVFPAQYFTIGAGQNTAVGFPLQIPFNYNKALTWRIVARAEGMSDGEENTLAVLSNRSLVTEAMPIFIPRDTVQHVNFEKLLNNKSESLTHESVTIEYTSNPVWYAVQALPYLIEFPYECAEQTFNRFYANTLASYIVNKHPRIKQVFEEWRKDTTHFESKLEKNQELKQLLLQETPWVLQAENEAQKKKNIALLFDLVRLSTQSDVYLKQLEDMQLADGSFSWFNGGRSDAYITNYILTGIGKLKRLGALTSDLNTRLNPILTKAMGYMDNRIIASYKDLVGSKVDLAKQTVNTEQFNYLFMRSFFRDIMLPSQQAYDYYYKQSKYNWTQLPSYQKAQLGLVYYRNRDTVFPIRDILPALLENAVDGISGSMYWKNTYTCFWYQSPIEYQSMMIAFAGEINLDKHDGKLTADINAMRTWLLLNKQTNNWRTTVATADACYALLLNGSDWLNSEKTVRIQLGNTPISSNSQKDEAGTGYFKQRIDGKQVSEEMGNITVTVRSTPGSAPSPSWGSIYWQYFEDLDKITAAAGPLSVRKRLMVEKNTDKGKVLQPVNENDELKLGDKIIVHLEIRSDRDMEYLHLKDMRAAAMEPVNVLSGYKWQDGLGYYESTKDVATDFFIDRLVKGTYVFEYPLFITHTGVFSVGIASIENMYAPEFSSHSEGIKIRVAK